jgi:hypothetical protein
MSLVKVIQQFTNAPVAVYSDPGGGGQPEDYYGVALIEDQILEDDGLYNGFPMPMQVLDGRLCVPFKKSGDHASIGPLIFKRSTLVSGVFEQFQFTVGGVPTEIAAYSWTQTPTGRFLVAYQDDELYTSVKIAYTDGDPANGFTLLHTIDLGAGYSSSPSPIKMIVMPSGAIRFYVYRYGLGANPALIQDIYLTDNGNTWGWGATMHTGTNDFPTGSIDTWKAHEVGVVITEDTGVDATCKMLAWLRTALPNDGGTYYIVRTSVDGGASWQIDLTEDAGPGGPYSRGLAYNYPATNSPVDMILFNGLVYNINGVRELGDYHGGFITATPAVAMANIWNTWSAITRIEDFNATTLGSTIDCGYNQWFIWKLSVSDPAPQLWQAHYDVSTEPKNPAITEDRCWIKQKRIV